MKSPKAISFTLPAQQAEDLDKAIAILQKERGNANISLSDVCREAIVTYCRLLLAHKGVLPWQYRHPDTDLPTKETK